MSKPELIEAINGLVRAKKAGDISHGENGRVKDYSPAFGEQGSCSGVKVLASQKWGVDYGLVSEV